MNLTDQFGRNVEVPNDPQRIISLVPSQTELLADLHLDSRVVGITRFCDRPREWFYRKARVGGTKDVDIERISALKPDLIIGNAEENTKPIISKLEQLYPVWISDVKTLEQAYEMMEQIGFITTRTDSAQDWVVRIQEQFEQFHQPKTGDRVLYLIWQDPWMAVGRDTFIHDMIEKAGFENCIVEPDSRYPTLTEIQIAEYQPDWVFLSSEPYPFNEKHLGEFEQNLHLKAKLVDGGMFSWYGTRLFHSPSYFAQLRRELQQ